MTKMITIGTVATRAQAAKLDIPLATGAVTFAPNAWGAYTVWIEANDNVSDKIAGYAVSAVMDQARRHRIDVR